MALGGQGLRLVPGLHPVPAPRRRADLSLRAEAAGRAGVLLSRGDRGGRRSAAPRDRRAPRRVARPAPRDGSRGGPGGRVAVRLTADFALTLDGVSRAFGGLRAVDGVSL